MRSVAVKNNNQEEWQYLPIRDFAHTTSGGTPKRGVAEYYNGKIPWIKSGDLNDGYLYSCDEFITELGLKESSAKLFKPGTILMALYGATIGRLSILNFEAATNQAVCGITVPESVEVKYLFYFLLSIRQKLIDQGKGGAQPNINQQIVKETVVPLGPLEQQKRIVAKIEELFSHIEAGIAALQLAKKLLKQYRQSVLKAAVTGKLTKDWREANKARLQPATELLERILNDRRKRWEEQQLEKFQANGKIPKDDRWKEKYRDPPSVVSKEQLPDGWVAVTAAQLAGHIVDGTHHTPTYVAEGVDFVSAKNVKDWKIDYLDTKKITLNEHAQLIGRCYPKKGDVLVTKSGTLGRVAVVKDDHVFSVFESVAVFPIIDKTLSEYIALAVHESVMGDAGQKIQKGIGVKHLHLEDLRKLEFWLPSKEELTEIFVLFDRLSSASLRTEEALDIQIGKAEKNRQSVLSAAFSGKFINWE